MQDYNPRSSLQPALKNHDRKNNLEGGCIVGVGAYVFLVFLGYHYTPTLVGCIHPLRFFVMHPTLSGSMAASMFFVFGPWGTGGGMSAGQGVSIDFRRQADTG